MKKTAFAHATSLTKMAIRNLGRKVFRYPFYSQYLDPNRLSSFSLFSKWFKWSFVSQRRETTEMDRKLVCSETRDIFRTRNLKIIATSRKFRK
ncbi:hypothetical protein HZH66_008930 [Vespula vulgaris]|uniref:Uncharacterized protein n=1 Tax=Vespula vulgaris TaxID=7454 RepID=A0A834JRR1_VESVU|nr:hypothetical protein HZH66_008930 [Vespula vulgaris]